MTFSSKKIFSILAVAMMVAVVFCTVDIEGTTNANEGTLDLGNQSKDVQDYFSEGTATYTYENNVGTLTLTDAKHVTTGSNTMAIHSTVDLVIKVIGKNTIELNTTSTGELFTLMCADDRNNNRHDLTITAGDSTKECSLTVTSEQSSGNYNQTIFANNTTISGGVKLTVTSGNGGSNHSEGFEVRNLNVSYSTLIVHSGTDTGGGSYAISCLDDATIDHSYVLSVADVSTGRSTGIYADNVSITNSEVYFSSLKTGTGYIQGVTCNTDGLTVSNSAIISSSNLQAFSNSQTVTGKITDVKIYGIKTEGGSDVEEEIKDTITSVYKKVYFCASRDVTYDTDGGSAVTSHKADTFREFTLPAAPTKEGYDFNGWKDESGKTHKAGAKYTMPGHDTKLTAVWVEKDKATVTVVASPSEGGTVTGGGSYAIGGTATVTAKANNGYEFVQWSDGSKDATHTFTVTGDVTLTATFKEKSPGPTPVPGSDGADPVMLVIWFFIAFLFACVIGGAIYQEYKDSQQKK